MFGRRVTRWTAAAWALFALASVTFLPALDGAGLVGNADGEREVAQSVAPARAVEAPSDTVDPVCAPYSVGIDAPDSVCESRPGPAVVHP